MEDNNNYKIKKYFPKRNTTLLMIIFFIYGMLIAIPAVIALVLTGYFETIPSSGVRDIATYYPIAYAGVLQWLGLIIGNYIAARTRNKINTKWILVIGLFIAFISLFFISIMTQLWRPINPTTIIVRTFYYQPFIYYAVFVFLFGIGIGPINLLTLDYLAEVYKERKKEIYIFVSNGLFSLGAAVIPFSAFGAARIVQAHPAETFVGFYIIALIAALIAFFIAFFVDYNYGKILKITKKSTKKKDFDTHKFKVWAVLLIVGLIITFYNIPEKIFQAYYNTFVGGAILKIDESTPYSTYFAGGTNGLATPTLLLATFIGVFYFILGTYRIVSTFTLVKWMKPKNFLLFSAIFMLLGFVLVLIPNIIITIPGVLAVIVVFAIGFGNLLPVLQAFITDVRGELKEYFVEAVTTTNFVTVIIATLLNAGFGTLLTTETDNNPMASNLLAIAESPWIIGLVLTTALIISLMLSFVYLKKHHQNLHHYNWAY